MTSIRLSVEQELTVRCGPHVFYERFTLKEHHEQGVAANEPKDVYRMITIDLNTIKFASPTAPKVVDGVARTVTVREDAFMMNQV